MRVRSSAILLLALIGSCAPHARAPSPVFATLGYDVDVSASPVLHVHAHFETTGSATLAVGDAMVGAVSKLEVSRALGWETVTPHDGSYEVGECRRACDVRYTLDVRDGASGQDGVVMAGSGAISPSYAWLLKPLPLPKGSVRFTFIGDDVAVPAGSFTDGRFATGLAPRGFSTEAFNEGSLSAFGSFRVADVGVPGATIRVSVAGAMPKLGESGVLKWVQDAGTCLAQLYGHFPVPRASVFLVPAPGLDEPVFGKVLSLGGPSILVVTGSDYEIAGIHDDWVLLHEMVHLGTPTFVGKHRWLGEGLATYFEPRLRTRMGWLTPARLFKFWAREMRRGVPEAGNKLPLDERDSIDDVYWGGALFLFLSDVRIRVATKNAHSLDDVVRLMVAQGGDATVVWTMDQFLNAGDEATGTRVLREMYERFGKGAESPDLEGLLTSLGIARRGEDEIELVDAPWASVRDQLAR